MARLIDKDALVAEIEKRQGILDIDNPFGQGGFIELELVKDILNTLELKEVDLQKEINKEWEKCNPIDEGMGVESAYIHIEAFDIIAKHFFELGIKAKQRLNKKIK